MPRLATTIANLAPGVSLCRDLPGRYNPRWGLAIYCLPLAGYSPASPGVVLGEALAARSGLGCTLLDGVPVKIPEGAVVVGQYAALKAARPDLLEDIPDLKDAGQYAVRLNRSALVTAPTVEGLAAGMQTLAMLILRHSEDTIPGAVIVDGPVCHCRGLAVAVRSGEIGINLLMQMLSFAATFKANRLQLILEEDFDPSREIPGVEAFVQACQSYGIEVGIRLPWLAKILSGRKTLLETWTAFRAASRVFGATQAVLDDPCPANVNRDAARRVVASMVKGESGLKNVAVDVRLIEASEIPPYELKTGFVTGWHRMWENTAPPSPEYDELPVAIDVQAPVLGFSSRGMAEYLSRLDTAMGWLRQRQRPELVVSFRNIGVSHMWQTLLYPAATGLITGWGRPEDARQAALLFSNLLYGETANAVMSMWDAVTAAFPGGLTGAEETLLRRTAFGQWPEDDFQLRTLTSIDWLDVTQRIRAAADSLKGVAGMLTRNATTLTGAKLSLHALSWLHCFAALMPELERRRRHKYDDDGRTEPIAGELYNNFQAWQAVLQELFGESGLEICELADVESMGLRLKGLCEGIFE